MNDSEMFFPPEIYANIGKYCKTLRDVYILSSSSKSARDAQVQSVCKWFIKNKTFPLHEYLSVSFNTNKYTFDYVKGFKTLGVDFNTINTTDGRTALVTAINYECDKNVIEYILNHMQRNYVQKNIDGQSPLHLAVYHHDPEVLQLLLDSGMFDVNALHDGNTPLHLAISMASSSHKRINILLKAPGIDVNKAIFNYPTPLIHAIQSKNLYAVEELIKLDECDVLKSSFPFRTTALMYATECGPEYITALLARKKYEQLIARQTTRNYNILHVAIKWGNIKILQELRNSMPENTFTTMLLQQDWHGRIPIEIGIILDKIDNVKWMLNLPYNLKDYRNARNSTLVHTAAYLGSFRMVLSILLVIPSFVAATLENIDGVTPLDIAKIRGDNSITSLLMTL